MAKTLTICHGRVVSIIHKTLNCPESFTQVFLRGVFISSLQNRIVNHKACEKSFFNYTSYVFRKKCIFAISNY